MTPLRPEVGARVLETERLGLRRLMADDTAVVLELLNDPDFIRFVGDRGVRTFADARTYILRGPMASYAQHGFGLWLLELKAPPVAIGVCGLLKREGLPDVDIGFGVLPRYRSAGYAMEAAAAVFQYGRQVLGLQRIVAIADPDNGASIRILEKLGMRFERMIQLSEDARKEDFIALFATL